MIPLETVEQQILVNYLRFNNYIFTSIPNSTYTKSIKQKIRNKAEWLNPWLPDLLIILKTKKLLFIEMKRNSKSLSKISEKQKEWINNLNEIKGVQAVIAYWAKEAIEMIEKYENI